MRLIDNYVKNFVQKDYEIFEPKVLKADELLKSKSCVGSEMLGWQDLSADLEYIKNITEDINSKSDCVLIIGIGGSYMGAKAAIEALPKSASGIEVRFMGNNLCTDYFWETMEEINRKLSYLT